MFAFAQGPQQTPASKAPAAAAGPKTVREAVLRKALSPSPEERRLLSGRICFDSVAYALRLAGVVSPAAYEAWPHDVAGALRNLVSPRDAKTRSPAIPAGYVVGVFRRLTADGPPDLCHVMLSLGNGLAVGSNNGCLGGRPDWSVHVVRDLLDWPEDGGRPPRMRGENGPEWALERHVFCRPVEEAVARFAAG
ncbi:hypothetical protein [Streptomyces cinnamoneus]|uniref:Uncharacterized protein n=1 Tax=Streptomyces cinnamoneus TaxID=53446 RepID=A0A918TBL9_STRCJ|nr:hypothetical protein [Streptomyces cinnamoneus]GHC39269.1 hypothetical protein GCM10010507_11250 [Streptomyces cinnamoneus]